MRWSERRRRLRSIRCWKTDLPLPGTSDRAFWIGLIVVSLSVISGLATYLILTGLTPIVPRNDVVLTALIINVLLVIAMVAVIACR